MVRFTRLLGLALLSMLAMAGLAFAAVNLEPVSKWFQDGLYVGSKAANPSSVSANKLAAFCQTDATLDFADTIAGYCNVTTATLTKCGIGTTSGTCMITAPATAADGGVQPSNPELSYGCHVSSTSGQSTVVTAKVCKSVADAGSLDPGSGPYHITVLK